MPIGLTRTQLDCLRVIDELTTATGRSPSYAEIAHEMDFKARSSVLRIVRILVDKGWVRHGGSRYPGKIVVLQKPPAFEEPPIELTDDARAALRRIGVA